MDKPAGTAAWFLMMSGGSPLPAGEYRVDLLVDGKPVTATPFRIGKQAAQATPTITATAAGPGVVPESDAEWLADELGETGDETTPEISPDGFKTTCRLAMREEFVLQEQGQRSSREDRGGKAPSAYAEKGGYGGARPLPIQAGSYDPNADTGG